MMQLLVPLVAAGAIIGTGYLLLRPHWVFVLIIAMWPVEQLLQAYLPWLGAHGATFNIIVGSLATLAVLTRLARGEGVQSGYWNPVTKLTYLLYILWALSALWSPVPNIGWDTLPFSAPYIGLLLVLLPLTIRDIPEFRRAVYGFMVLGSIVSVLIMVNPHSSFSGGRLSLNLGFLGLGLSHHGNPLALGSMGAMLALSAALIRPARLSPMSNAIRVAAFISGMGLAIGSGSRGQVLAAVICGVALYPMARRLANPKQFIAGAIGFGVLVFGLLTVFKMFIGRQNEARWDPFQMLLDATGRWEMVMELAEAYIRSPAHWPFGLGMTAFIAISKGQHVVYVHNVAAEAFFELGVAGAILFVSLSVLTVLYAKRLWWMYRHQPSERSAVAVLAAYSLFATFTSLKQGSLGYPEPFFWWLILAKIYMHERRAHEEALALGLADQVGEDEMALVSAEPEGLEPPFDGRDRGGGDQREPEYAMGY
jgi:hypothetical protein